MSAKSTGYEVGKSKIEPVRMNSDDCAIMVGQVIDVEKREVTVEGKPVYVHKGEHVMVIPSMTMETFIAMSAMAKPVIQGEAITGQVYVQGEQLKTLCEALADDPGQDGIVAAQVDLAHGEAWPRPDVTSPCLHILAQDDRLAGAQAGTEASQSYAETGEVKRMLPHGDTPSVGVRQ